MDLVCRHLHMEMTDIIESLSELFSDFLCLPKKAFQSYCCYCPQLSNNNELSSTLMEAHSCALVLSLQME